MIASDPGAPMLLASLCIDARNDAVVSNQVQFAAYKKRGRREWHTAIEFPAWFVNLTDQMIPRQALTMTVRGVATGDDGSPQHHRHGQPDYGQHPQYRAPRG